MFKSSCPEDSHPHPTQFPLYLQTGNLLQRAEEPSPAQKQAQHAVAWSLRKFQLFSLAKHDT